MFGEMRLTAMFKYDKVVIGIDQSYNNTGISIAADRKLIKKDYLLK